MRGYGVSHLFYVNSIVGPAMLEMDKVGVKRVVAHGEKAAAYMADGYARACRRPGVCLSQDIGTTNLLAGMRDAHMACTPVIAITGGQNDLPRYRHAYQNAEDFRAWETVTKANYSVDTPQRFPDLLRQAFRDATTGTPGPVHLELRGNSGQSLDREAEYDLTFEERFARYPAFRPVADAADVHAAIKALRAAAKPIIVVGGGAVSSDAGPEIIRLAEKLSIPIATSLHARALVPDDHPLNVGVPGSYSRWCANQAIAAADLVFFVGSHTGGQVTNGWQVPRIAPRRSSSTSMRASWGAIIPTSSRSSAMRKSRWRSSSRPPATSRQGARSGSSRFAATSPTTGPNASRCAIRLPRRCAPSASARTSSRRCRRRPRWWWTPSTPRSGRRK
jgi:acetolactate synthase-1/2/3 large subunit